MSPAAPPCVQQLCASHAASAAASTAKASTAKASTCRRPPRPLGLPASLHRRHSVYVRATRNGGVPEGDADSSGANQQTGGNAAGLAAAAQSAATRLTTKTGDGGSATDRRRRAEAAAQGQPVQPSGGWAAARAAGAAAAAARRGDGVGVVSASGTPASPAGRPAGPTAGAAPRTPMGPAPPPPPPEPSVEWEGVKPEWQKILEEAAADDPDVAEMLAGAGGDPAKIEANIRARFEAKSEDILRSPTGAPQPLQVTFREVDTFNLWLWLELESVPSDAERTMLEEVIRGWFVLGRLGGFNADNLQATQAGRELSFLEYDGGAHASTGDGAGGLGDGFHNVGEVEYKRAWARVWCDMGTSDELALDVLINALTNLSTEYLAIRRLIVGGVNADWAEGTEGSKSELIFKRT